MLITAPRSSLIVLFRVFLFISLLLYPLISAAAENHPAFPWGEMSMSVCGGLALFLYGMDQLTSALKASAGANLQNILARLTTNRFTGALVGAVVTAIIQSSSVTTVLVVGFVSAGVLTLAQSIGVIMGANIGTTVTAQIIAFKVTQFALLFVAAGFLLLFFGRRDQVRSYGGIVFGLGLVFFGMGIMSEAMSPLHDYPPFIDLMIGMERPLLGLFVGALFTALIQSSSATTGVVVVLASQGFITLSAGIALALGANVGTCVTAMLAAIGKSRAALRAAAVHVFFNLSGVLLWVGFIDQLAAFAAVCSPAYPELSGISRVAAETPRQIANANTFFNIANTLVFISFTPVLGRLVSRIIPDKVIPPDKPIITPRYLDNHLLDTPSAALDMTRMEIGHLGYQVLLMLSTAKTALEKKAPELYREVEKTDDLVDILHQNIMTYLSCVGKCRLTDEQSRLYFRLMQSADTLEAIGDILETDMTALGQRMLRHPHQPSATTRHILDGLYVQVAEALEAAIKTVVEEDRHAAQNVLALRRMINEAVDDAFRRQAVSLAESDLERLAVLQMEYEMTDKLKQIYSLSKRIARFYLPRA